MSVARSEGSDDILTRIDNSLAQSGTPLHVVTSSEEPLQQPNYREIYKKIIRRGIKRAEAHIANIEANNYHIARLVEVGPNDIDSRADTPEAYRFLVMAAHLVVAQTIASRYEFVVPPNDMSPPLSHSFHKGYPTTAAGLDGNVGFFVKQTKMDHGYVTDAEVKDHLKFVANVSPFAEAANGSFVTKWCTIMAARIDQDPTTMHTAPDELWIISDVKEMVATLGQNYREWQDELA